MNLNKSLGTCRHASLPFKQAQLSIEAKELLGFNIESIRDPFAAIDRRSVDPSLYKTDELDRVVCSLCQHLLCESRFSPKLRNLFSKLFLKHVVILRFSP